MGSPSLEVSPLAQLLLDLAARKATGQVHLGERRLLLRSGDVAEVFAAPDDESLEDYLTSSGRIEPELLEQFRRAATAEDVALFTLLSRQGVLKPSDLFSMRRSLWLDRITRGLEQADGELPVLDAAASDQQAKHGMVLPLLPLLLDAMTRRAALKEAAIVGSRLNHRLRWLDGPHGEAGKRWARLSATAEHPAVSTILARQPAAAPRIAALLRAGLCQLDEPGSGVARKGRAGGTLPPPPPRLSVMPAPATPEPQTEPDPLAKLSSARPPRMRLDPGAQGIEASPLSPTPLRGFDRAATSFDDPLLAIEAKIKDLEGRDSAAGERARAHCAAGDLWRSRYGSIERACNAFRQAASADTGNLEALHQAALHCHYLGDGELSLRYAEAAVEQADLSIERAAAQTLRATLLRAQGRTEDCIEALCEALADDPSDPEPHEVVATMLAEAGNLEGANAHARLAAAALQDEQRERALSLLSWAAELLPGDLPTAYEYAAQLDALQLCEAAVAVLAEAGAQQAEPGQRLKLRLSAAQRGEAGQRSDLAAELLVDIFDEDPQLELVHAPLDQDLEQAGLPEIRVAVLEDVATVCPRQPRASFLQRAGEAMLGLRGEREAALWLYFEAVLTEPAGGQPALEVLRQHARTPRELELLCHALRATIAERIERDPEAAAPLLRELAEVADKRLGNPHLALAALTQLTRLGREAPELEREIRRLTETVAKQKLELSELERRLSAARPEARPRLSAEVAKRLPDLPDHWPRLAELLSEALSGQVETELTAERLETVYGLSRDPVALAAFLDERAANCDDRSEKVRLLARLAAVQTVREDTRAVASACQRILELQPDHRLAIARLERAARKLADAGLLEQVLTWRVEAARTQRERARALCQLSKLHRQGGQLERALELALSALEADPSAADAGLLVLRHADRLPAKRALAALSQLRVAWGGSARLLAQLARLAHSAGEHETERRCLEDWCEISPRNPSARVALIAFHTERDDEKLLWLVSDEALTAIPTPQVFAAAERAVDRLAELGAHEEAARLQLRLQQHGTQLQADRLERVLEWARDCGSPTLTTRALELRIVSAKSPTERRTALSELVEHHNKNDDLAAEARAILRYIELAPEHLPSIDRLVALFARAGDVDRLSAVAERALSREKEAELRRKRLLDLAVAQAQLTDNPDRVEFQLRRLVAESVGEPDWVRRALGVLLSIGDMRWALSRCEEIAGSCPPELGSAVYAWTAATADKTLQDTELSLAIAVRGCLRFPAQAELLLTVERLTLGSDDAPTALSTYDTLIERAVGPHGRRALQYRAGRWLERSGRLEAALERYLAAFELAPSAGVAFKALERVARRCGQLDQLLQCYETLAEQAADGRAEAELLRRASQLCMESLGQPERAFSLLHRANQARPGFVYDAALTELAQRIREHNQVAGERALAQLTHDLEQRAKDLWDPAQKARCLLRLGALYYGGGNDPQSALEPIDQAIETARGEQLGAELLAEALTERARVLQQCGREQDARQAVAAALDADPKHGWALALREELGDKNDLPRAHRRISTRKGPPKSAFGGAARGEPDPMLDAAGRQSSSADLADRAPPPPALPQVAMNAPGPAPGVRTPIPARPFLLSMPGIATESEVQRRPTPPPKGMLTSGALESRTIPNGASGVPSARAAASGAAGPGHDDDSDDAADTPREAPFGERDPSLARAAELLGSSPATPGQARLQLRNRVCADPSRLEALRELHQLAMREGERAESWVCSQILSTFDTSVPPEPDLDFHTGLWRPNELRAVLQSDEWPFGFLLSALWDHARAVPHLRRACIDYGVSDRDAITRITISPVSVAYAQAARILDETRTPVYVSNGEPGPVVPLPTTPPCVVADRHLNERRPLLLFWMARALWLARAEHIVAAVLEESQARALLDATLVAFGPSDERREVSDATQELAAALWQAVPANLQRELGRSLSRGELDYPTLRDEARSICARAGLLASGCIDGAFQTLARTEPALEGLDLRDERDFVLATQRCKPLADVVRCALSDAFLGAVAQTL